MTNKEKIEWLEGKLTNTLGEKKYYQKKLDWYEFEEGVYRREIDRLYDIENKNDNIKS